MKKTFETVIQKTSLALDTLTVDLASEAGLSEISIDMPFKNGKPRLCVGQEVTVTIEIKVKE